MWSFESLWEATDSVTAQLYIDVQTQINIILFICYWKEILFMLRNIASLVLMLWFNYDLFWMFFSN